MVNVVVPPFGSAVRFVARVGDACTSAEVAKAGVTPADPLPTRTRVPPHDDTPDGDVYVSLTAPDRKVRLGFLPEGPDGGLWRINAYEVPFGPPAWGVCFNDSCPTELATAFTTALAAAYEQGPDAYPAKPVTGSPDSALSCRSFRSSPGAGRSTTPGGESSRSSHPTISTPCNTPPATSTRRPNSPPVRLLDDPTAPWLRGVGDTPVPGFVGDRPRRGGPCGGPGTGGACAWRGVPTAWVRTARAATPRSDPTPVPGTASPGAAGKRRPPRQLLLRTALSVRVASPAR
jgi:uncharacterized protein DUF317